MTGSTPSTCHGTGFASCQSLKNRTSSVRISEEFADVTDQIVAAMIEEGILADCGMRWQDENDPSLFVRDIRPRREYFYPPSEQWT